MNIARFWSKPWAPEVCFTGSREGMTDQQIHMLTLLLSVLAPSCLHHGDCVGSDEKAHDVMTRLNTLYPREQLRKGASTRIIPRALIHIHPGPGAYYRAGCHGDLTYPVQPFLDRNHHLVDMTDLTIATPKEAQPVLRSGTWATFRYSMGQLKPTVLIQPDGTTVFYDSGKEIMKTNVVNLAKGSSNTWTDNGNGDALAIHESPNGYMAFYASGTWDSGSLKLQVSPDDSGSVWIDVASSTMTADGYKIVQVFGRRVRGVLGSVASAASLTVKLAGVVTGLTVTNS